MPDRHTTPPARLRLRLTAAAENTIRGGHPWVFDRSILEQNRDGAPGELAVVYDRRDKFLALGLFDPHSPIRVRVLHTGKPVTVDRAWWAARLETALAKRRALFDDRTTGWRWIHGENDGWPGLVLDRYGDSLVLKLYTAAWLPRLDDLLALLRDALACERVVLRLSRNIQQTAARDFNVDEGRTLAGQPPAEPVVLLEQGLQFEADLVRGQKTGFFLDQRENRVRAGSLAAGCDVLNAFSFSGGFSVHAARGGARSVTDLDISPHALASARRNFALNRDVPAVAACRHQTVQADAFDWLANARPAQFDLVILDPPSFAKRQADRDAALSAYARLASEGARVTRPGGLVVTASCSAHVTAEEFFGTVRAAMRNARVGFTEIASTLHPPDHPATIPEAHYLKCLYLRLGACAANPRIAESLRH